MRLLVPISTVIEPLGVTHHLSCGNQSRTSRIQGAFAPLETESDPLSPQNTELPWANRPLLETLKKATTHPLRSTTTSQHLPERFRLHGV